MSEKELAAKLIYHLQLTPHLYLHAGEAEINVLCGPSKNPLSLHDIMKFDDDVFEDVTIDGTFNLLELLRLCLK